MATSRASTRARGKGWNDYKGGKGYGFEAKGGNGWKGGSKGFGKSN
jgi:hypothetical protein